MTYKELVEEIGKFTEDQLVMDITIYDENLGEYTKAELLFTDTDDDILEGYHPYFKTE